MQYLGMNEKSDTLKVVITVPAYFDENQRRATLIAGQLADLEVVRILNEPTAAAMAYGLQNIETNKQKEMNILVFDLGGGTFDVTVLNLKETPTGD